jgi:type IV pilus assembly protein PilA
MKLDFQAKFLQHLNKKKSSEEGFTLIELLVVIIIIGSLNRAQQAYFLENDSFATTVVDVGIGIKTQSVNYNYTISGREGTNADGEKIYDAANNIARARGTTLKSYLGQNFTTVGDTQVKEVLTLGFVCETIDVGTAGMTKVDSAPFGDSSAVGKDQSCPEPGTGFKDLSGTKKGV